METRHSKTPNSENQKQKTIHDVYPGAKIGRWSVTDSFIKKENGGKKWLCNCDCGTNRYVLERNLKSGGSYSCGCAPKEKSKKTITHDIKGKVFGALTALHIAKKQPRNGGVWWTCLCACTNTCDVPATLLVKGQKTHCGCKTQKNYHTVDITGKRIHRLTALYPTQNRDKNGTIIWHCRCDCGKEVDYSYHTLMYTEIQSCGCLKKEFDQKISGYLTHVAGTSIDMLKSQKLPKNNTSGTKGVYLIGGKWTAKIVFQKKQYYLGNFKEYDNAVKARKYAEKIIQEGTVSHYERWKKKADADPQWAKKNPIKIRVEKSLEDTISIVFLPEFTEE